MITLFIKGIFIGVANIIPGVSGGTIAVVLRVFDELIEAVNNIFKDFKKYLPFLLPLGAGAVLGIFLFSKLISFCLTNYSFATNLFFVGLVVGSVPLIYKKAVTQKVKPYYYLISLAACALVIGISLIRTPESAEAVTVINASLMLKMLAGGTIASAAMVIPGISGSFVMVLMGMYGIILHAIANLTNDFVSSCLILVPAGIGIIIGILLISKVISILLDKAFSVTYFSILGLILGSIFAILKDPITYQSHPDGLTAAVIAVSAVTFAIGFVISIALSKE